jgi:hypothetical protein
MSFLNTYEWTDYDIASYELGIALGVLPLGGFQVTHKWVVASDNPMGNVLWIL